jgi:hypothetical protein
MDTTMDTFIKSLIFRKCQNVNVIDLDDEGVLYKENSNDEKLIVNTTVMAIWDLLDGKRTSFVIAQEIAAACGVKCEAIEADIYAQLAQFEKLQLIEQKRNQ